MPRFKLLTALAPEQCLSRLSAAGDIQHSLLRWPTSFFGSKPVVGLATTSALRLRKRANIDNSFQTHLVASMRAEAGGTAIVGTLGMHPAVEAFMVLWFGGVLLLGGSMFVMSLRTLLAGTADSTQNVWMGILVPPLMLAFGYGLVRFGRHLARDEERFLRQFLISTLDAHEVDVTSPESRALGRSRGGWGAA